MGNLSQWPDQFCAVEDTSGTLMGYSEHLTNSIFVCVAPIRRTKLLLLLLFPAVMGKTEGRGEDWQ